jgi:hypothetical protein
MKKCYNDMPMLIYLGICFVIGLIILSSCVTAPQEEIDWRRAVDKENFRMCEMAYKQSRVPMIFDHRHDIDEPAVLLRGDLLRMRCKMVLREYWAEY